MTFAALGTLATAVLLSNGDFERGGADWTYPEGSCWRIVEKAGRRGGACAVFDTQGATNEYHAIQSKAFPVKPGGVYRYEAYVKSDDPKPQHLEVVFSCLGPDGRFLFNNVARKMKDNAVNTGGWVRYEGMTDYLPYTAGLGRMFIHIPRAEKGVKCRFRVDDFAVFDEAVAPVDALYSSAYRDTAAEGTVRFVAPYRLDPKVFPPSALEATYRWLDAAGKERTAVGEVDAVKAELRVDAKDLKLGRQAVTVTLKSRQDGAVIGMETNFFTRVEKLPPWKVYIDSKNRLIRDGKPFFSIKMSWDEVLAAPERREEMMRIYKRGPFNAVNTYIRDLDKDDLDFFHSHGLATMCNLKDIFVGVTGTYPPDGIVLTEADEEPYVRKIVARCKDHPALLYWYINDELPLQMLDRSIRRHRLLHELDADHPTSACLDKPHHVRSYMKAFDMIGTDPYPVGKNTDLSIASGWARQTREGTFGLRLIGQTVQVFDWRWYFPEGTFPNMRFPSREEIRSMAWQQIVEGSWGISFYSFEGLVNHFKGEEFDRRFGDVCAVAQEISDFIPVFCSDEPEPEVAEVPPGVVARAWRYEGKVRFVVINVTMNPLSATLVVDGERKTFSLPPNAVIVR